ncbi:MAG: hypothetical protein EZS28_017452 [Streblomastix strix]|uniref:Uncharacterized protein n=1 Tax=Streblomastix strix TaxID=222440 RepID=A0A5J4VWY9_9EUKA|nr:MAG: hypothetical protein EZS28_017452 [Streblomastix strix]
MQAITNATSGKQTEYKLPQEHQGLLNVVEQLGDIKQPETLGQRISNALVDLYNYVKFPANNKSDHKSEQIVDVSRVANLAVVDKDLHKTLNEMQKDDIRNKILQELGSYKSRQDSFKYVIVAYIFIATWIVTS